MTTLENPLSSVETSLDHAAHAVYADWLEEHGDGAAAHHRLIAAYLSQDWERWHGAAPTERIAARSAMLSSLGINGDRIRRELSAANGRRRERTLSMEDVFCCAMRAVKDSDGWNACGGDGYQSYQTVCLAVRRTDGTVRVGIAVVDGSKGSSLTTQVCGLTKRGTAADLRAWADQSKGPS